jgi:hypothetical protein
LLHGALTVDDSVRQRTRLKSVEISDLPFNLSHGHSAIDAIILHHLRRTLPINLQEAFRGASLKLRASFAAQHQYIVLDEENFSDEIKRVYRNAIVRQNAVQIQFKSLSLFTSIIPHSLRGVITQQDLR